MSGVTSSGPALAARIGLVAMILSGAAGAAQARDGFSELFGNLFGGGRGAESGPIPQPDWAQPDSPPLTVRPHPRAHKRFGSGGSQRYDVAALKGITIYTDKTLTRGDAVMTPTGLKVFSAEHAPPYTDDDFVAIADAGRMSTVVRKQLIAIDDASRPELHR